MRPLPIALLLSVVAFGALASGSAAGREIDNVATFARLYGVVRYFYPSDAAASLDWNPFAVYGVKQARAAPDASGLETTLKALFGPLGPGIEIGQKLPPSPALGTPDTSLIAWRYVGAGVAESNASSPYKAKRTHRSLPVDLLPQGPQFRRFWPPHHPVSNAELFESAPTNGAHGDIDLGLGLKARVPLALPEAQARGDPNGSSKLDVLRAALGLVPASSEGPDVDARLAGILVAWNVFRHFYPHWAESGVDWDSRLRPQLELAYAANGRDAQRDALRQLVADASDGHGSVVDTRRAGERAALPIQLGIIDDRLVVTASDVTASGRLSKGGRFASHFRLTRCGPVPLFTTILTTAHLGQLVISHSARARFHCGCT